MTFKIFQRRRPAPGAQRGLFFQEFSGDKPARADRNVCALGVVSLAGTLLLAVGSTVGCRTITPLGPVDLKAPGWTVHQGQAVWHLENGTEIAGELLVATQPDGRAFVQFTKSPFALVVAQETPEQWQVEFPPQNKHYAGLGAPPKRLIWLYLPIVLGGKAPPENWIWHQTATGWHLTNYENGESLEGFFDK